jgi:UDP-N-acetylglucosamine diphosphorylase / glucose-1-phosphate thymidylyltransferase / UDP-N-acetylgalactosamine diphosphorylase / glucosamine-1-phosphate N-acetyltransferase / galactosamine-1-phosphate N-acetyltransferase
MSRSNLIYSDFFDLRDFPCKEIFESTENVWDVLSLIKTFLEKKKLGQQYSYVPHTAHLVNPSQIYIGENVVIEPGAYIKGPCYIGDESQIRHGAYLRGNVIIGKNCVVGHDTEVKNSILLNKAQAAHFAYVGDCILGYKVNLGAGVKCANLKLNHSLITIQHEGESFLTKLKKFGAIIGDEAQLGCNCVTNPGTLIGKKSFIYPCVNVGGVIPSNSKVKSLSKVEIIS